jgi:hypothetical protein
VLSTILTFWRCRRRFFQALHLLHVVIRIAVAAIAIIVVAFSVLLIMVFVALIARVSGLSIAVSRFEFFLFHDFSTFFLDGKNGGLDVSIFEVLVIVDSFENVFVEPNLN